MIERSPVLQGTLAQQYSPASVGETCFGFEHLDLSIIVVPIGDV